MKGSHTGEDSVSDVKCENSSQLVAFLPLDQLRSGLGRVTHPKISGFPLTGSHLRITELEKEEDSDNIDRAEDMQSVAKAWLTGSWMGPHY